MIPEINIQMTSTPIVAKPRSCWFCEQPINATLTNARLEQPDWATGWRWSVWHWWYNGVLGYRTNVIAHPECLPDDWEVKEWTIEQSPVLNVYHSFTSEDELIALIDSWHP